MSITITELRLKQKRFKRLDGEMHVPPAEKGFTANEMLEFMNWFKFLDPNRLRPMTFITYDGPLKATAAADENEHIWVMFGEVHDLTDIGLTNRNDLVELSLKKK